MAHKLGDILLKEGLVTQSELDEALKYQVIFGGKLGTNLIEMGVLDEDDITNALSRLFKVPAATPEEIDHAPRAALDAIPLELIKKYGVVPIKLEGRRLTLAMNDPANLQAIDEISFRTGLIVRPAIAAEVRLVAALERHYNIERDRRYIHTEKKVIPRRKPAAAPPAVKPASTPAAAPPSPAAPPAAATPAPTAVPQAAAPAPEKPVAPPLPPVPLPFEPVEELEELSVEEEIEDLEDLAALDYDTLSQYFAEARDRDDILTTLAAYLSTQYARVALFLVRGDMALGWQASIDGEAISGFNQVQIPLEETSVLKTVAEARSFYLGPIPRAPFNSMLLQEIGGRVPESALLVPVQMMGRVVGILYVDSPGVALGDGLYELQKLTAKAAMAFEILVLKNKILSM